MISGCEEDSSEMVGGLVGFGGDMVVMRGPIKIGNNVEVFVDAGCSNGGVVDGCKCEHVDFHQGTCTICCNRR